MVNRSKLKRNTVLTITTLTLGGWIFGASALAKNKPARDYAEYIATAVKKYAITIDSTSPTQVAPSHGGDNEYTGMSLNARSNSALGCLEGSTDPNLGWTTGCTYWDFQRNGTTGRLIAVDPAYHVVNHAWTGQYNANINGGRDVFVNFFDPNGGIHPSVSYGLWNNGMTLPSRAGFPSVAIFGDGLTLNAHQSNISWPAGTFRPFVFKNSTPGFADFSGYGGLSFTGRLPDSIWTDFSTDTNEHFFWPQLDYSPDDSIAHLVLTSSHTGEHRYLYTRRVGGQWQPGFVFGNGGYISPTVIASQISSKVAIAWIGGRGDGTVNNCSEERTDGTLLGQADNDVYYMISDDAGATWSACTNLSLRPDANPGGFAPGARLSVAFDDNDDLHIAWDAMQWPGYNGTPTFSSRMYHWSEATSEIRIAADGVWTPENCNGGAFNLNVTQPQLSVCDGKLYLTYNQFAPVQSGRGDDCSQRAADDPIGAANGEVYLTVSDDDGINWDPPRSITDSYTPGCDTLAGGANPDCLSDAWHSTTRYGIDISIYGEPELFNVIPDVTDNVDGSYSGTHFLFTQYITDYDPGSVPHAEGGWQNNRVMLFRFGCVEPQSGAVLSTSIPAGQVTTDTLILSSSQDLQIPIELANIGNATLIYSATISGDIPAGNLSVIGNSGSIGTGLSNTELLTVTLNASNLMGATSFHAEIEIAGNFQNSPRLFVFDYQVCDDPSETVDTLAGQLVFNNRGSIGLSGNRNQGGASLGFTDQNPTVECNPRADVYLFDASPIVSYPGSGGDVTVSGMYAKCSQLDSTKFHAVTGSTIDAISNETWILGNSGEFRTFDSALSFSIDFWAPKTPFLPDNQRVVYGQISYWNTSGAPLSDVYCAAGWDWDVPSDSSGLSHSANSSSFDAAKRYVLLKGIEIFNNQGDYDCTPSDERFAMTKYFEPIETRSPAFVTGAGGGSADLQAMYSASNAGIIDEDWDYSQLGANLQSMSGFSAPGSASDVHVIANGGAYTLNPDDTLYLYFAMTTGIGGATDFTQLDSTVTANRPWEPCCVIAGDADHSGATNIGDVTFLIARIFSGGPAPVCCAEASANGDFEVNISDVTYLIARIFAGGPAPACGPNWMGCE